MNMKKLIVALWLVAMPTLAFGQGGPGGGGGPGPVPNPWIVNGGTVNPNGLKVVTTAPTTGQAGFNLPAGTAPTAPVNGDVWTTTGGLFSRVNGVSQQSAAVNIANTFTAQQTFNTVATVAFSPPTFGGTWLANNIITGSSSATHTGNAQTTLYVNRTANGSGLNGSASADYAAYLTTSKTNYLTSTVDGELDTIFASSIQGRKGDGGVFLPYAAKVYDPIGGTGGTLGIESSSRWLDPSTGGNLNDIHALVGFLAGAGGIDNQGGYGFYAETQGAANSLKASQINSFSAYYGGALDLNTNCPSNCPYFSNLLVGNGSRSASDTYFKVTAGLTQAGDIVVGSGSANGADGNPTQSGGTRWTAKNVAGDFRLYANDGTTNIFKITNAGVATLPVGGLTIGNQSKTVFDITGGMSTSHNDLTVGSPTYSGTSPWYFSLNENWNIASNNFGVGFVVQDTMTGGTGAREAMHINFFGNAGQVGQPYVALQTGSTNTGGGSGQYFGGGSAVIIQPGANVSTEAVSWEFDTLVQTAVSRKVAVQIVDIDGSTNSGPSNFDAGLLISAGGSAVGYGNAIQINDASIKTGGNAFVSPNVTITKAGAVTAPSFTGPLTGNATTVTTNANLTGPITSVGNATSIAAQTGTGATFAMQASPTFTGTLGASAIAATGVISSTISAAASSNTITITNSADGYAAIEFFGNGKSWLNSKRLAGDSDVLTWYFNNAGYSLAMTLSTAGLLSPVGGVSTANIVRTTGAESSQFQMSLGGQEWRINSQSGGAWYLHDQTNNKNPIFVNANPTATLSVDTKWNFTVGRIVGSDATDASGAAGGAITTAGGIDAAKTVWALTGFKTGSAGAMMSSSVAWTNGAAAALGTLTNAPVAGPPTKWIPVNDNGTTRYIPAW